MMRNSIVFLLLSIMLLLNTACDNRRQEIEQVVKAWYGKRISFPEEAVFTVYGKDTVDAPDMDAEYKILMYVDSIGCSGCKMNLLGWKVFMDEMRSISNSISYLFIVHPNDVKNLRAILRNSSFNYPICIDKFDLFNRLNHFIPNTAYQTFLLDKNMQVIALGNPISNQNIKKLYLDIICGSSDTIVTSSDVKIYPSEFDFGNFSKESILENYFTICNIGQRNLKIKEILVSCDCIEIEEEFKNIAIGQEVRVYFRYHADEIGLFNREIFIKFDNDNFFIFRIKGNVY